METGCSSFGVILGNEVKRVIVANFSGFFIRRSSNSHVNYYRMHFIILRCIFSPLLHPIFLSCFSSLSSIRFAFAYNTTVVCFVVYPPSQFGFEDTLVALQQC